MVQYCSSDFGVLISNELLIRTLPGPHALQPVDLGHGGLGGAFLGLLRHDDQRHDAAGAVAAGFVLNDGGDGDLMLAEDAGDFGQHAGAVFDGEPQVVAAREAACDRAF